MAVRSFNGASDDIVHTVGTSLSGMTHGTVAALVQRQGASGFRGLLYTHTSGGSFLGAINVWENDLITWFTASQSQGQTISVNVWYLIVARKASGSSAPRFSIYNFSTDTWSHQNGSNNQANWTSPGAGGTVRFSFQSSSDFWSGLVAVRAAWSNALPWATNTTGDSQIEAAGLESTLQAWFDASPTSLWRFDQAVETDPVDDLVGDADQSSRSGTTVVTGNDPPGFVFDSAATDITVEDSVHDQVADSPTLTQAHELAVDGSVHEQVADQPTLTQVHSLLPDGTIHEQVADEPILVQAHDLSPSDSVHDQVADSPTITQAHIISPDGTVHEQVADQPVLTSEDVLLPHDSIHDQVTDEPILTQHDIIAANDAVQVQVADQPSLTGHHILVVNDAVQVQVADSAPLITPEEGIPELTGTAIVLSLAGVAQPQQLAGTVSIRGLTGTIA